MSVNNCDKLYQEAFNALDKELVHQGDNKFPLNSSLNDKFNELKELEGVDVKGRILDYTSTKYKEINRSYLKGEGDYTLDYMFRSDGNYNKPTYRGTKISKDKLNGLRQGDLINNKLVLSSTSDFDTAEMFAENPSGNVKGKPVIIEFDNSNSPAYDIAEFSTLPKEQEVLVAPKSVLEVQSIDIDDSDIYRLKVKVLNSDEQTSARQSNKQNITNIMSLTGGAVLLDKGFDSNKDNQ